MQPKPAIFASSRACIARGTGSSNRSPSTGESTNHRFLKQYATPDVLYEQPATLFVAGFVNPCPHHRDAGGQGHRLDPAEPHLPFVRFTKSRSSCAHCALGIVFVTGKPK
jgi:hypothetical protein